jgi:hypothetical protein
MKKNISILLLSFLVTQILISCQKNCQSNLLGSVRFSQTDLNIIPYKGNEQFIYVASSGHQIIFNGANRISHYGAEGDEYVEFPKSDDYCPGNYYYTETNHLGFYGTVSGSWINFDMVMTNPFSNPIKKYLGISITVLDSIYWVFANGYRFDSLKLYNENPPYGVIPVNDSVLIGSKIFYNVRVLVSEENLHSPTVSNLKTVFYSLSEGVLGFQNELGETWCLQ